MDNRYKKAIDEFLAHNWDFLMECSKNITRSKKRQNAGDLAAELALYLYDNREKIEPYMEAEEKALLGFSVSWLKLQSTHKTTPFSRKYDPPTKSIEDGGWQEPAENPVELTENEYIRDLRQIYTEGQIENIIKIHGIYPQLSGIHKTIFDAYFIEGLSMDKIRQKYSFFKNKNGKRVFYKGRQSIFYMLRDLKEEIRKKL